MTQPDLETKPLPLGLTAVIYLRPPTCRMCSTQTTDINTLGYCKPCFTTDTPTSDGSTT